MEPFFKTSLRISIITFEEVEALASSFFLISITVTLSITLTITLSITGFLGSKITCRVIVGSSGLLFLGGLPPKFPFKRL